MRAATPTPSGSGSRGLRATDCCVVVLTIALLLQSSLLLHLLSETASTTESTRPVVRALITGSGGAASAALSKWYCGKTAKSKDVAAGGKKRAGADASAGANVSAQCAPEVEAALEALPTCRPVHIFQSCHALPTPNKVCASCAPAASPCPAIGHAITDGEAPPLPSHDHYKATEAEELDEFGEALKRRFTDMSCHLYPDVRVARRRCCRCACSLLSLLQGSAPCS